MKRKLFCELGPVAYQISEIKETALRLMRDLRHGVRFARTHQQEPLPCLWKGDDKIIRRQLHGVDMRLQENKAVNLRLAGSRIDGLIIRPGETFSFYETVLKDSDYLWFSVICPDGTGLFIPDCADGAACFCSLNDLGRQTEVYGYMLVRDGTCIYQEAESSR